MTIKYLQQDHAIFIPWDLPMPPCLVMCLTVRLMCMSLCDLLNQLVDVRVTAKDSYLVFDGVLIHP